MDMRHSYAHLVPGKLVNLSEVRTYEEYKENLSDIVYVNRTKKETLGTIVARHPSAWTPRARGGGHAPTNELVLVMVEGKFTWVFIDDVDYLNWT